MRQALAQEFPYQSERSGEAKFFGLAIRDGSLEGPLGEQYPCHPRKPKRYDLLELRICLVA